MATVHRSWSEVVPADAVTVLQAVQSAGNTQGCRFTQPETWIVEVHRGSQGRIRLLGFLAKPRHIPIRARVELSPSEMGTLVEIKIVDTFGFGPVLGLERKFERSAQELLTLLIDAARSVVEI